MEAPSPSPAKSQQIGSPASQRHGRGLPPRADGAAADESEPRRPMPSSPRATPRSLHAIRLRRAASASTEPSPVTRRGQRIWRLSPVASEPTRGEPPPPWKPQRRPIAATSPPYRYTPRQSGAERMARRHP